jgi:hypothetical protein
MGFCIPPAVSARCHRREVWIFVKIKGIFLAGNWFLASSSTWAYSILYLSLSPIVYFNFLSAFIRPHCLAPLSFWLQICSLCDPGPQQGSRCNSGLFGWFLSLIPFVFLFLSRNLHLWVANFCLFVFFVSACQRNLHLQVAWSLCFLLASLCQRTREIAPTGCLLATMLTGPRINTYFALLHMVYF